MIEDAEPTIGQLCHVLCNRDWTESWNQIQRWPPDVFAITSILLQATGAYRLIVAPPVGEAWPPGPNWADQVRNNADAWAEATNASLPPPPAIIGFGQSLQHFMSTPISTLVDQPQQVWPTLQEVLTAHATADEACEGLGIPRASDMYANSTYMALADAMLVETGSLSNFETHLVRVLPKMRTPQVGINIRSLSQHVHTDRTQLSVYWRAINDVEDTSDLADDNRLNLLILPWPRQIGEQAFRPVGGPLGNLALDSFGFFDFVPEIQDFEPALERVVTEATRNHRVHAVVFPEAALTDNEYRRAEEILAMRDIPLLLAGVRGPRTNLARLSECCVGPGEHYDQHKHHRWCIERRQIRSYELGFSLNPSRRWWEDIDVRKRELQFLVANEWLCLCVLVCEDLARVEPVQEVVRGVGPTLVVALLQDGPQLKGRWPGQYATVLADDPGSSVLTLTSLGMALRSRGDGFPISRVVALWKDRNGPQELKLEEGADGILLCIRNEWEEEWSADGRSDDRTAAELVLVEKVQVRASKPTATKL